MNSSDHFSDNNCWLSSESTSPKNKNQIPTYLFSREGRHNSFDTMAMTRQFGDFSVRMKGTPEDPMFCVKDVCGCLGIRNHHDKIRLLKDDEKLSVKIHHAGPDGQKLGSKISTPGPDAEKLGPIKRAPGQSRTMVFCTEAGLYRIIFSLQKNNPVADRFQHWVFHEVLPSIRKTGSYSVVQRSLEDLQLDREERRVVIDERMVAVEERRAGVQERLLLLNARQDDVDEKAPPSTKKSLSATLRVNGYNSKALVHAMKLAGKVSSAYWTSHGKGPDQDKVFRTNLYSEEDWPLIQAVVAKGQTGIGSFFNAK